jgi:hypothetical protein
VSTDPLEIAQVVLARLGDLVRKLPTEVVKDLYDGTATLEVVPKGGRRAAVRKPAAAPIDVEQVRADLARIDDRAAAATYVRDLGLTVAQLQSLAAGLAISMKSKIVKDEAIKHIVEWTVGRRLTSESISRPAASRF